MRGEVYEKCIKVLQSVNQYRQRKACEKFIDLARDHVTSEDYQVLKAMHKERFSTLILDLSYNM